MYRRGVAPEGTIMHMEATRGGPRGAVAWLVAVFLGLLTFGSGPVQAQQFTVTIGGADYRVALVTVPETGTPSYDQAVANNTFVPFTLTPWFGAEADAQSVATQVRQQSGTTEISYRVPFNTRGNGRVDYGYSYSDMGSGLADLNQGSQATETGTSAHFWVIQYVVPEIDGPVLGQAIFALGAFYLVLRGGGRRRQMTA